jgi:hypothetical protein
MAQRILLVDDLDGTEAEETITYTVDGQDYEIDLSEDNAKKFRDVLAPFLEKSRTVERQPVTVTPIRTTRRRGGGGGSGRDDLTEIREWAKAQGHQVSERGRIKKEIIEEYDAAHSK